MHVTVIFQRGSDTYSRIMWNVGSDYKTSFLTLHHNKNCQVMLNIATCKTSPTLIIAQAQAINEGPHFFIAQREVYFINHPYRWTKHWCFEPIWKNIFSSFHWISRKIMRRIQWFFFHLHVPIGETPMNFSFL